MDMPASTGARPELTAELVLAAQAQAGSRPRMEWLADQLDLNLDSFMPLAAQHFHLPLLDMATLRSVEPDFTTIPFAECQRRSCLAARMPGAEQLLLVIADPTDVRLRQWLEARVRRQGSAPRIVMAGAADLQACLAIAEKSVRAMDSVQIQQAANGAADGTLLAISISNIDTTQSPVVRLVDSTLLDALRAGASDIHLETQAGGLTIKYRLDGVLVVIKQIDSVETAQQAISRIKVVAELDIAERRVPQDGRFKVVADGREIDFRVSIMPNLFGEDAVLRVLDRKHLTGQFKALTLDTLGFDGKVLDFVRQAARMPYGLLLVTGPTGSGKTTTLYAAISEINTGLDKIVTIEDPIEYQLAGVLQIPVNEKKGLTFARGLRSILRHDPDKIMVGEIRDAETAHIAVQSALTGHQVFTTVHANNVFDVIGRFANMGVDSYSLVAALNGILAQRLLRMNCPHCAAPDDVSAEELRRSGLSGAPSTTAGRGRRAQRARRAFMRGQGCAHCRGTGYKGRRAIAETLPMNDNLRDLLAQRAPLSQIRRTARSEGFVSLRDAAVALALSGDTTLEEINRVTPVE
jgi:general secretion pathway protein E